MMSSKLKLIKPTMNNFPTSVFSQALIISALILSQPATSGAWVAEKGSGYAKLAYERFSADKFRGNNPTFENFDGQNTSFYGEYGLGHNFAIYGTLLYQSYEQSDSVLGYNEASGFSDTEIGLRYQWQANPFVLSTSFLVKSPFLYANKEGLGNHQEDYEARILIGKSLNEFGYFGIELGYRLRTGEPSDEYRYLLEYGFNFNKSTYFRTKIDGVLSAENSDVTSLDNTSNLSNPLEYDSGKLELTLGYNFSSNNQLNGLGVEVTYTHEVYGNDILEGNHIQLGLTKVF